MAAKSTVIDIEQSYVTVTVCINTSFCDFASLFAMAAVLGYNLKY